MRFSAWQASALWLAGTTIVASGAAALNARAGHAAAVVLFLPMVVALAVPYGASGVARWGGGAAALGFALGAAAGVDAMGDCFLILASFGLFLAAACAVPRARGARAGLVYLTGAIPGVLLVGAVFWMNPVIEALASTPAAQRGVVRALMGGSPLLEISARVLQKDLLLQEPLYSFSAVAARGFTYPPAWQPAAAYAGAALFLAGLACAVRKRTAQEV